MTVATLQLLSDARHGSTPRLVFLAVALPQSGMVLDRAIDIEQDLVSPGVDYQRWLRLFAQFPITEADTIIDTADYSAAITLARTHAAAAGRYADLTIVYGSRTIIYRKVKIRACRAVPRIGSVTGSGTTGSPAASVRTQWQWQCTEDAQ